jgi:ribokinase
MTDLVVIGSLNVDLVIAVPLLPRPGETVAGPSAESRPGGKGANQACAAARLGANVRLAGLVGDDAFGAELLAAVAQQGVDVAHVATLQGSSTGMAFIAVEESSENLIVVASGANGQLTPAALADRAGLRTLLQDAGALLLQLETPLPASIAAAQVARELRIPVILNAAPCPPEPTPELGRLLQLTDVLIVNEPEALTLTGSADPAALLELGPAVAVVTLGRRGASAADETGRVDVPGFVVQSVDTVGAGDTFCGQFALAFASGAPLYEAVRRSCAAGALATTTLGAQSAAVTPDRVAELVYEADRGDACPRRMTPAKV